MSQSHYNAKLQADATISATKGQIRFQQAQEKEKQEKLNKCIEDLANFDHSSLFRKTDKELAKFQAEPESPQYALALNEWNRRLVVRQMRNTRFSAYIGIIGTIIGVLLGKYLG
jgi:ABC-type dipeptide/oligopeptide/nickel transport system permease subunit